MGREEDRRWRWTRLERGVGEASTGEGLSKVSQMCAMECYELQMDLSLTGGSMG